MTEEQEQHLKRVQEAVQKRMDEKYRAGAIEHGGSLELMGTLDVLYNAFDETIDQAVYIYTAIEQIESKNP